jgi:UDP-N-acetylglucosamine acyltransferase
MGVTVHPLASVDPKARLADGVEVGPFCLVGPDVEIGPGTRLISHVSLTGCTTLGAQNVVYPFCSIGGEPQDVSYKGTPTRVEIGDGNTFRESVSVHRATEKEDGLTRIGNNNYFMGGSHVAHDCWIGDHVWCANNTALSGHVRVLDYAALSGLIGVHHFVTIGSYCFIGGCSRAVTDVPPYMLVEGNPAEVRSVNLVGLRRRGFTNDTIKSLMLAHRLLWREMVGIDETRSTLAAEDQLTPEVTTLLEFLEHKLDGRVGRSRERKRYAA